jgi:hypothetical protein
MACGLLMNAGAEARLDVQSHIGRDAANAQVCHELPGVVDLVVTLGFLVWFTEQTGPPQGCITVGLPLASLASLATARPLRLSLTQCPIKHRNDPMPGVVLDSRADPSLVDAGSGFKSASPGIHPLARFETHLNRQAPCHHLALVDRRRSLDTLQRAMGGPSP